MFKMKKRTNNDLFTWPNRAGSALGRIVNGEPHFQPVLQVLNLVHDQDTLSDPPGGQPAHIK
jgi:hypothetical protein